MATGNAIHVDTSMFGLPPVIDRVTGESGYIGGWWRVKHGGYYILGLLKPKGKAAVFCIAHQRIFQTNEMCPECTDNTVKA